MHPLFAFFGSPWEMAIVLLVVLLLFGNRLPSVMRSLGQGVTEFKKGLEGIDDKSEASAKKIENKSSEEHPANP